MPDHKRNQQGKMTRAKADDWDLIARGAEADGRAVSPFLIHHGKIAARRAIAAKRRRDAAARG